MLLLQRSSANQRQRIVSPPPKIITPYEDEDTDMDREKTDEEMEKLELPTSAREGNSSLHSPAREHSRDGSSSRPGTQSVNTHRRLIIMLFNLIGKQHTIVKEYTM